VAPIQPALVDLPAELVGPRVVLRPYRESDAAALWAAVDESRQHLSAWLPWISSYRSVEDALLSVRQMQAKWILREDLVVAILDRASGRLLGGSGLHRIDWGIRCFEIGYWVRQSAVGHGYITEAVQVLTRFAFDVLEGNRVQIRMDVRNTRSRAVPQRLGFVHEGCLRRALPDVQGEPRDVDVFSVIREDYERLTWPEVSWSDHHGS
jgi:RimJ/RimL family protein N-acetyltransferase